MSSEFGTCAYCGGPLRPPITVHYRVLKHEATQTADASTTVYCNEQCCKADEPFALALLTIAQQNRLGGTKLQ